MLTTIQHHIYSPYVDVLETLSAMIEDILASHADFPHPDFWKGTTATTISLLDFMCYVAVPHVANLLIAADFSVMELEADKMWLDSLDHGNWLYEADDAIDDIAMHIVIPICVLFFLIPTQ
jgi:hypothetical protein